MRVLEVVGLAAAVALLSGAQPPSTYDLVVYGGTSAGVIAAVQAKRMGKSVVLVGPDKHLGGLSSGGLGFTDTGNKAVIGGLSREFYHRVWKHYDEPDAWKWQKREEYGNKGQGTPAIDGEQRTMWIFEPHVAEQVFEDSCASTGFPFIATSGSIARSGVKKDGARITSITTLSGKTYAGKMFIDATYEGDLMAAAGVEYHVGREARQRTTARSGTACRPACCTTGITSASCKTTISPYVVPGDPTSGVLPRISTDAARRVRARATSASRPTASASACTDHPGQPRPVPEARRLRPEAVRTARSASSTPAGARRSRSSTRSPTARPTRTTTARSAPTTSASTTTTPKRRYERRREILKEHETLSEGLALLHRQRSARAGGRAEGDAPLGPAEGRVHGQRRLAAPDLRPRGPPDDRHVT